MRPTYTRTHGSMTWLHGQADEWMVLEQLRKYSKEGAPPDAALSRRCMRSSLLQLAASASDDLSSQQCTHGIIYRARAQTDTHTGHLSGARACDGVDVVLRRVRPAALLGLS